MTTNLPKPRIQGVRALSIASVLVALLLAAAGTADALPLPQLLTDVPFSTRSTSRSYTIDLGGLPARPALVVEATPSPANSDVQLEITMSNWQFMPTANVTCPDATTPALVSTSGPGAAVLERALYSCVMTAGGFAGGQVTVRVRVVSFGAFNSSASVTISIRGETRVLTGTSTAQVDTDLSTLHHESLFLARDTVIYSEFDKSSNGQGSFLWAGTSLTASLEERPLHSLLAFSFPSAMPAVARIVDADLTLQVTGTLGGGGNLSLWQLRPPAVVPWLEGNANAAGNEFTGATSSTPAATWIFRSNSSPLESWLVPGGDVATPALAVQNATAPGSLTMSTTALVDAVQGMFDHEENYDGFLLSGPSDRFVTRAVQLGSNENSTSGFRPRLTIDYVLSSPYASGAGATGAIEFLDEGQNLRWIYDLDHDNVVVTSIGGICTAVSTTSPTYLPYTYRYAGVPGYTGVDCCTWRIESPGSGTVGSGQVIFYHNLDPNNPANIPPDSDSDGIRNLCDNCPNTPNGPLRGSCVIGPYGLPCRSNPECGNGGLCSLAQEDVDGDFTGNACVPEPDLGVGIVAGLAMIAARSARSRRAASLG